MKKIFNGKRLKEARLYNKLTITKLAETLNITKQMVSKYERGRSEPSFEKSLQLIKVLGYPREFFYTTDKFLIENEGTFFRSRLTATQKSKYPASIALRYSVIVRDFLEQYIDFPDLWHREVYEDVTDIEKVASSIRNAMNLGTGPIHDVIEMAELMGFTVINMNYQEDKVDAFSSMNRINGKDYFIVTTGNSGSFYRQQFSITHEIGHWALHQNINPQELDKDEYKLIEEEAKKLASTILLQNINPQKLNKDKYKLIEEEDNKLDFTILLPKESFGEELKSKIVDEIDTYYNLKRKWNVSMAAMIKRAGDLKIISVEQQAKLY